MKRKVLVLTVLAFLLMAGMAFAQTWHTANQTTFAWDAVTTLSNGDPVPVGDTIEYEVFIVNAITDPGKTSPTSLGLTTATSMLITLVDEGSYFVGAKSFRKISDGTVVGESIIAWSDDPQYCLNGEAFGIRYFLPPSAPGGFHPQ
jgi:hypothetical protein